VPSANSAEGTGGLVVGTGLQVRYRGGALGIHDGSLDVAAGSILALLGPNGAGKTTTVRAISGFLRTEGAKVTSGRVLLDGEDITNAEPHKVMRRGLAFVPERQKVFSALSVRDNILAVGRSLRSHERNAAVERVCELFPMLSGRLGEAAGRLSGGQQQMLAIGRAIVLEPKALIIDEMTLGLHPSVYPPLFAAVQVLASQGAAVIIVDESAAMVLETADRCVILRSGKVAAQGDAAEFRGRDLVAASYTEGEL